MVYQRPKSKAAGAWLARAYDPATRKQRQTRIGTADDYSDANGRDVLNYTQAQEKALPWFKLQEHLAVVRAGGETVPEGPYTVATALADYLADARRQGRKSVRTAELVIAARIEPSLGSTEVAKLTRSRLEQWQAELAASPRLRTGKQREGEPEFLKDPQTEDAKRARKCTANRIVAILKRALNLALENRRVVAVPVWREVKPFKGVTASRTRFLSREEQVRLVNACPPDFRRLVQGALLTGSRYGELTRLQVQDFNAKNGSIVILESKNGKPRHVVLTEEGKDFFVEATAGRQAEELIFQRDSAKRRKHTAIGNAWSHSEQTPYMAAACRAAKLDAVTFHELRHTYASMLVNKGVPLAYVAAQLGHSSTRMVEKHYGHLAPTALVESIRRLAPKLGILDKPKTKPLKVAKAKN